MKRITLGLVIAALWPSLVVAQARFPVRSTPELRAALARPAVVSAVAHVRDDAGAAGLYLWMTDGPLTPIANLRGRTDENGYLLVNAGAAGATDGPLTPIGNLRGRTNESGYLRVAFAGGAQTLTGPLLVGDGTAAAPSYSFASTTTRGIFNDTGNAGIGFTVNGTQVGLMSAGGWFNLTNLTQLGSTNVITWTDGTATGGTGDLKLARDAANTLAQRNGANAQTFRVGPTTSYASIASSSTITPAASVAAGGTVNTFGEHTRGRYQVTIAPATGDCSTAFNAAALTADCTIATLPAGMRLVGAFADVTAGFTCSATCSGTKVMQCGITGAGTEILAAGFNVAATGQAGDADAELGSAMTRAAAIQGGYLPSWSATTPVVCRFTSGTGNWGTGAATNVNAGSVKITLTTELVK